jgi:hypothetical protein
MIITENFPTSANKQNQRQAVSTEENKSNPISANNDSVQLSDKATKMSVMSNIASRYDTTNMSEQERVMLAKDLREAGLIDERLYLMMSFEHSKVMAMHLGEEYTGNDKQNMLESARSALEFVLQNGGDTPEGLAIRRDIIAIYEQLNQHRGW